jgi:hypothetical protein
MSLELWKEITAEYNGKIIKGSNSLMARWTLERSTEARQIN